MSTKTCPCGFVWPEGGDPWSPELHRQHREHHLAKYPNADDGTRGALDSMIATAERHQQLKAIRTIGRTGARR